VAKPKFEKKLIRRPGAKDTHPGINGRPHRGDFQDCNVCHWDGPKSICSCGHPGDGSNSSHAGSIGHGECLLCPSGRCQRFTWGGFYDSYKNALEAAGARKVVRS